MEPAIQNATHASAYVGRKNPTVHVLDALMGEGKSTYLIRAIADACKGDIREMFDTEGGLEPRRWIVIVPSLKEVARYVEALNKEGATLEFPNTDTVEGVSKTWDLLTLVNRGENVVCTHALFNILSPDVYKAIEAKDYNLVVDEEIEVVRPFEMPRQKVEELLERKFVVHDPVTRRLSWNSSEWSKDRFPFKSDIPKLCDAGHLVLSPAGLLIVELPNEFLRCFEEIWIATYMFAGAPLRAYLEANRFTIERHTVAKDPRPGNETRHLLPWGSNGNEAAIKAELRSLIKIWEGPMNKVGANQIGRQPLTATWFKSQAAELSKATRRGDVSRKDQVAALATSTSNFFRATGTPPNERGWTCLKGDEVRLRVVDGLKTDSKEKDNSHGHMAYNMRASNDYANVSAMAYLVNVFLHGDVKTYFDDLDIPASQDLYALSTLVQWIWRSRIRKDPREPITVYIPSERMRGLFREWLASNSTADFVDRKMREARYALDAQKGRVKGKRYVRERSTEVGFERSVEVSLPPLATKAAA